MILCNAFNESICIFLNKPFVYCLRFIKLLKWAAADWFLHSIDIFEIISEKTEDEAETSSLLFTLHLLCDLRYQVYLDHPPPKIQGIGHHKIKRRGCKMTEQESQHANKSMEVNRPMRVAR